MLLLSGWWWYIDCYCMAKLRATQHRAIVAPLPIIYVGVFVIYIYIFMYTFILRIPSDCPLHPTSVLSESSCAQQVAEIRTDLPPSEWRFEARCREAQTFQHSKPQKWAICNSQSAIDNKIDIGICIKRTQHHNK